jgi:hypothetical protein
MIIYLKPDDARIGKYAEDGAIVTWPDTDIMGQPYERRIATVRRVSGGFVCVAPDVDGQIEAIVVEQPTVIAPDIQDQAKRTVKRADVSES